MASLPLPTAPSPLSSTVEPIKTSKYPKLRRTHHLSKPRENPKNPRNPKKSFLQCISSLCKEGLIREAFAMLTTMELENLPIGPEFYVELLQGCLDGRCLFEGLQIHGRILKSGAYFQKNGYLETKLVIFYAKFDILASADNLFLRQCRPNVFSWAAMIGLYCRGGLCRKALTGFCEMLEVGFVPDNYVIPNAVKACSALQLIRVGKAVHGYVLKIDFGCCVFVLSSLVDLYGKCGILKDARKIFDKMPVKNVITWNSLLVSCVRNGLDSEAIKVFYDMRVEEIEPTRVTIASYLSAAANLEALEEGRQGHAIAILSGLELDSNLVSSVMNFYSKVGLVEATELAFKQCVGRDMVTWNLLISSYVKDGQIEKAFNSCRLMRKSNLRFDSVTLASVLSACADTGNIKLGREGHGYCIRNNLETDLVVINVIVEMYSNCGRIECARKVSNL